MCILTIQKCLCPTSSVKNLHKTMHEARLATSMDGRGRGHNQAGNWSTQQFTCL